MKILDIQSPAEAKLFHQVPHHIYAGDANWIAPLKSEVEGIFHVSSNPALSHGDVRRFVLLNDSNKPVGRIAAFVDDSRRDHNPYIEGGVGFFECENKPEQARLLFEAAETFLRSKGVEVIDGPVNYGQQRDKYWGLLVKGFHPPLYQENYNPAYYEQLFLDNGYQPFEQILTYVGESKDIPFKRLGAIAKRLKERQPMHVKAFSYDDVETFANDFSEVYNASFRSFEHFNPIRPAQIINMMKQAKPILDTQLACIAYYENQPAGFIVLYPDINPLLKFAKGEMSLWKIPRFLFTKSRTQVYNAKGMGFGIHPDHQSKGIFALLIDFLGSDRNLKRYPKMYLAGIRTHNHQIRSIYAKLGVDVDRIHVAYRKPLKEGIDVVPHEFL